MIEITRQGLKPYEVLEINAQLAQQGCRRDLDYTYAIRRELDPRMFADAGMWAVTWSFSSDRWATWFLLRY